jgi:hypothetical protein
MGAETEAAQTEKDRKALAWRHAWRIGTRRRGYGGRTRFRPVASYRWSTGRGWDVHLIWCAPEAADGACRGRVGGCAGE